MRIATFQPANRPNALKFCAALVTLALLAVGCAGRTQTSAASSANPDAAGLGQFTRRVDEYVALQKKLLGQFRALKKPDDPVEITARKKLLGDAIRNARLNARPGDIFVPRALPRFLRIIREDMQNRPKEEVIETLKEGPEEKALFTVNQVYPENAAMTTMPALLLTKLPRLPESVEYRFIGRHFIIRDVEANIIVDYIMNAVPLPKPPV